MSRAEPIRRRRARRFAETDLRRFLESGQAPRSVSDGTEPNVGALRISPASHFAAFYETDAGGLRIAVPFLRDGLRAGLPTLLLAEGRLLESYLRLLGLEAGIDLDAARAEGRFRTWPGCGRTRAEALAFWEQACWEALANGPTVIRAVAEMSSMLKMFSSLTEMIATKVSLTPLVKRFPMVLLCQFDMRLFDGATLMTVIKAHPDLHGVWLENFLV